MSVEEELTTAVTAASQPFAVRVVTILGGSSELAKLAAAADQANTAMDEALGTEDPEEVFLAAAQAIGVWAALLVCATDEDRRAVAQWATERVRLLKKYLQ